MRQGAVILAGGSGERLFPYSNATQPKQFLPLVGNRSMLQETYRRLVKRIARDDMFVVTQEAFRDTVLRQLPEMDHAQIILEPSRRDTSGAIALALARWKDAYDVLLFCPADHHIEDGPEWEHALQQALDSAATTRRITLFGIVPNYPETGYGYVEYEHSTDPVCPVVRFHEKPSRDEALTMVRSGQYLWNCGIFAIPCDTGITAFEAHLPAHHRLLMTPFDAITPEAFEALPKVSIDYGLMEKMQHQLAIVPSYFGWNDLGTWAALERILHRDAFGNHTYGDVKTLGTADSIVFAPEHEVYLHDVSNLLVVCHDNQVLVANKDTSGDMKQWLPRLTKQS